MRYALTIMLILASSVAFANVGAISIVNNTVPSGGFLLDGSAGFITPDVAGNKIFAR